MALRVGARLRSTTSDVEVVVVKAGTTDVTVACGGSPMVGPDGEPGSRTAPVEPFTEPSLLGKRYVDDEVGVELLCTKGGAGALSCDGRPLTLKSAKPLPSSD